MSARLAPSSRPLPLLLALFVGKPRPSPPWVINVIIIVAIGGIFLPAGRRRRRRAFIQSEEVRSTRCRVAPTRASPLDWRRLPPSRLCCHALRSAGPLLGVPRTVSRGGGGGGGVYYRAVTGEARTTPFRVTTAQGGGRRRRCLLASGNWRGKNNALSGYDGSKGGGGGV